MTRVFVTALFAIALIFASREASAGYTHYWKWLKEPERAALGRCVAEMTRIADARREILSDGAGKTGAEARFDQTCEAFDASDLGCLAFNGVGAEKHETFSFPVSGGAPAFSFVKTALKPYDAVVVAALIVARDHFDPDTLDISSDGDWGVEWESGAKLYSQVLGRRARNPMSEGRTAPPLDDAEEGPSRVDRYGGYAFAVVLVAAIAYIARQVIRRR
ncbi:MAG: hypothetical protein KF819_35550 [Labilithrix sp.]|nr:hypothetical protein [Labilithrix sp.]